VAFQAIERDGGAFGACHIDQRRCEVRVPASRQRNRSAALSFFGLNDTELKMAVDRKPGRSRKTTTRNKTTTRKKASSSRRKPAAKAPPKRWSQRVTRESDALDLKRGVFGLRDPKRIAASLKRSAERSSRRKSGAYRSALSMLTFYINRAGKTLPKAQRDRLERAKGELKRQFGRE
jgi:hypothetical protein